MRHCGGFHRRVHIALMAGERQLGIEHQPAQREQQRTDPLAGQAQ